MKITFLGTGTSTGVPEIGCKCKVCSSTDKKDRRLRASVLVDTNDQRILIDCGPDFREQMLNQKFSKLNGVLLTHEHYDHTGGIDDLRPFCKFGDVDIYGSIHTNKMLRQRIPYCFAEHKYPGVPNIILHDIDGSRTFYINDTEILPINIMHYKLSIYGYRIGKTAYLTDVKYIPENEYEKLKDLDTLIISSLRIEEHISHQTLSEALTNIERIAPKRAYLTHMSHQIGLHAEVEKILPENVFLAYDGLEIETN